MKNERFLGSGIRLLHSGLLHGSPPFDGGVLKRLIVFEILCQTFFSLRCKNNNNQLLALVSICCRNKI